LKASGLMVNEKVKDLKSIETEFLLKAYMKETKLGMAHFSCPKEISKS
jgi:hypothetical protein